MHIPDHDGLTSSDLYDTSSDKSFDCSSNDLSDVTELYSEAETEIYSDDQYCNILSINVGGLVNRIQSPDFEEFINKYDIICIQETHFDAYDSIHINGYTCLPTIVRVDAKYRSGGIAILVRNSIYDTVQIVKNSSEYFYWFKCSLFSNVLFCVTYIPPEGSKYSDISIFDDLEFDLLELNQNESQICLLGDFNARTGNLCDFVTYDDSIEQFLQSDNPNDDLNRLSISDLGFSSERHNSDAFQINNYGKRLLEVCRSFNLCIGNGRLGHDMSLGKKTCKGSSVIDYAILSPLLFTAVKDFEILPFEPMVSDAHCGVRLSLSYNTSLNEQQQENDTENINVTKAIWSSEAKEDFLHHLNEYDINQFVDRLNLVSPNNVSREDVEILVSECSSLLFNAADAAGMIKHSTAKPLSSNKRVLRKSVRRPWFNAECQRLRSQYRRSKNHKRRVNNVENFQLLTESSKAYKKCINKRFNEYKKDFIKKLRALKNSDAKSYWKLLNQSDSSNKSTIQRVSLATFADHFKKLNTVNVENSDMLSEVDLSNVSDFNLEINAEITENEVLQCLNNLKQNKACASDLILNEFLKFSKTKMLSVYTRLFNIVFTSGFIPEEWSQGIISPIYKNKGDKASPDNYRGITILSCFGKLFTAVLNNRLNKYLDSMNILSEEQAGFRKQYSTTDHIFNLKCLIDLYLFRGKKLYCAFIDYKKAFDSINRTYLWQKLISNNIDGKMFKIIHSLYANAKSCVKAGNLKSDSFSSNVGVRQGENLSPVLFSIFLNDLSEFISHAYDGLDNVSDMAKILLSDEDVEVYFKLYILLYADDTVIFAESGWELQAALNAMFLYCKSWDLEVNPAKTKVTIFSNRKLQQQLVFTYNGHALEMDEGFVYLGVLFSYNGRFQKHNQRLADCARKAMFAVLRKSRKLHLPVDLQLQLFDSIVTPILLYGSEVSGFENCEILEKLCIEFYKIILHAKKSTPNVILYGELGRYHIDILVKARMIGFWQRIINGKPDKISHKLYKILLAMHQQDFFHSKWLLSIKNVLHECDKEQIWLAQEASNSISKAVKQKLTENFKQTWKNSIFESPKCLNYRIFKQTFEFEKYLDILPQDLALAYFRFRSLNHKFPIEWGRFVGIARDERICSLCPLNQLGDEYHYGLECTYFDDLRKLYLPRDMCLGSMNTLKFKTLMNTSDSHHIFKLAKYCKEVLKTFQEIFKNI